MNISPIYNTRAFEISLKNTKILVVGDLHLGISAELAEKGVNIPNQAEEVQNRLLKLLREEKIDRLFLLGDVKHNIPVTSRQEWEKLPDFLSELNKEAEVNIIPGNHDGDIQGLTPRNVNLHETKGASIGNGRIGLVHGHAWPDPELFRAETIIMAHNHPTIKFRDEMGGRVIEPAWIKTRLKPDNLPKEPQAQIEGRGPKITIIPAFSKLVGGGVINEKIPEELLGPLFKAEAIELEEAKIHLLDGTFLGELKNLRELADSN